MTAADPFAELRTILEAICEDRLTAPLAARLDELTLDDSAARRFYLEYMELHGNLYWDAAQGNGMALEVGLGSHALVEQGYGDEPIVDALIADAIVSSDEWTLGRQSRPLARIGANRKGIGRLRGGRFWLSLGACATAAAIVLVAFWGSWPPPNPVKQAAPAEMVDRAEQPARPLPVVKNETVEGKDEEPVVKREKLPAEKPRPAAAVPSRVVANISLQRSPEEPRPGNSRAVNGAIDQRASIVGGSDRQRSVHGLPPVELRPFITIKPKKTNEPVAPPVATPSAEDELEGDQPTSVVGYVDAAIKRSWKTASIEPSPLAGDAEWLRRVYLDTVGHIPSEEAVNAFLDDDGPQKRAGVVEKLLKDSGYARYWATVWTNLLVGRQPRVAGISREGLEKFLRDSFAANVGWNEVVFELVSAEGSADQNPAANFLLAHLNNEAVPATALTARLFLGLQVQCAQCHDHPFHADKQNRFWELNSFFQQTEMVSNGTPVSATQMASSEEAAAFPELVTRHVGGPMYYETRRGEMRAAFPVYAGQKIDPGPEVNRRRELGRLIAKGDDRQLARAMVNRMWQHFFGYGFTRPIDDMGSHNPPTHPAVLNRLTKEFVASGYDLKQLIRWICGTDAYQRASTLETANRHDDPATGSAPLFSRVYLKPMTAEQLYDSLLIATRAKSSARTDWNDTGRRRQDWVRQFVISYGTDENDETTTLTGTVSQALLMMNDHIVQGALGFEPGTLLFDVAHDPGDDDAKIRRLCRSALSRDPSEAEVLAGVAMLQQAREDINSTVATGTKSRKLREQAEARALQDILWAYLNANEFALVH